eukprot:79434-Chlamydomonas_euryale.AAC.1
MTKESAKEGKCDQVGVRAEGAQEGSRGTARAAECVKQGMGDRVGVRADGAQEGSQGDGGGRQRSREALWEVLVVWSAPARDQIARRSAHGHGGGRAS